MSHDSLVNNGVRHAVSACDYRHRLNVSQVCSQGIIELRIWLTPRFAEVRLVLDARLYNILSLLILLIPFKHLSE